MKMPVKVALAIAPAGAFEYRAEVDSTSLKYLYYTNDPRLNWNENPAVSEFVTSKAGINTLQGGGGGNGGGSP